MFAFYGSVMFLCLPLVAAGTHQYIRTSNEDVFVISVPFYDA